MAVVNSLPESYLKWHTWKDFNLSHQYYEFCTRLVLNVRLGRFQILHIFRKKPADRKILRRVRDKIKVDETAELTR